jgi:hypothetical protein
VHMQDAIAYGTRLILLPSNGSVELRLNGLLNSTPRDLEAIGGEVDVDS